MPEILSMCGSCTRVGVWYLHSTALQRCKKAKANILEKAIACLSHASDFTAGC